MYIQWAIEEKITEPEKFGELAELKAKIGNGIVICMANDLLPVGSQLLIYY